MKVKLLRPWKTWPAGHIFSEMPPNVAAELFRRGIAEEAEEKPRRRVRGAGMQAGLDYETR